MNAEEFKKNRNLLSLTQSELAVKLQLSERQVRLYESGASNIPYLVEKFLGDALQEVTRDVNGFGEDRYDGIINRRVTILINDVPVDAFFNPYPCDNQTVILKGWGADDIACMSYEKGQILVPVKFLPPMNRWVSL